VWRSNASLEFSIGVLLAHLERDRECVRGDPILLLNLVLVFCLHTWRETESVCVWRSNSSLEFSTGVFFGHTWRESRRDTPLNV